MEKRPNIVLIMTDQQRFDTINAAGFPYMVTPNLDRLADGGVLFDSAFCPGATCVASRAAMFTGMYPHTTGVYSFNRWAHHSNVVKELSDAGYYCANLGKMHVMPLYDPAGFHERRVVENKSTPYGNGKPADEWSTFLWRHGVKRPTNRHETYENWDDYQCAVTWEYDEELHSDSFVGTMAQSWIRNVELNQPLFLQIGFAGPHEPYDPPARFLSYYDDKEIPLPVRSESELCEKPIQQETLRTYFRDVHGEARINTADASPDQLRRMRKHYYANITLIDEMVGHVVQALDERGLLENTVLIFASDHGDNLGDHGLAYKWVMYDSVVRVPMIIRDFRPRSGEGPRTCRELVSLLDLAPTMLEYASVGVPDYMEGVSLVPIVAGETGPAEETERRYVFCEDNYLIMVRSATHKLVYYIGQDDGELYDLSADPNELRNRYNDPAFAPIVRELESVLLRWLAKSNYFNGRYKTDGERNYATRWPSDEHFGPYLQGSQAGHGTSSQSVTKH